MKVKYRCPNCDAPVLSARWEMGYEYCTNQICVDKLGKRKVSIYESPPIPGESAEISPFELDDVVAMFEYDD